jgi:hypothetical protein
MDDDIIKSFITWGEVNDNYKTMNNNVLLESSQPSRILLLNDDGCIYIYACMYKY